MRTATVRDLRNHFPRVAVWIEEGQLVEITRAGKPFARLLPANPQKPRRFKRPDIMARLKEAFGDRVYSAEEVWAWGSHLKILHLSLLDGAETALEKRSRRYPLRSIAGTKT